MGQADSVESGTGGECGNGESGSERGRGPGESEREKARVPGESGGGGLYGCSTRSQQQHGHHFYEGNGGVTTHGQWAWQPVFEAFGQQKGLL